MNNFELISFFTSKLTIEQIENFSDEEINSVKMERPGHPGQFGFMLNQKYFQSTEHHSQIMFALLTRLTKVKN